MLNGEQPGEIEAVGKFFSRHASLQGRRTSLKLVRVLLCLWH
jgi:hypothetical protein